MKNIFDQKWRVEHFDDEYERWLLLLLGLVKYDQTPEDLLPEFISSDHYTVTKRHKRFIIDQVC